MKNLVFPENKETYSSVIMNFKKQIKSLTEELKIKENQIAKVRRNVKLT